MGRRGNDKSISDPWGYGLESVPRTGPVACFECGTPTKGRHHVIPKVHGGNRQVPMCQVCHNKCHGENLLHSNLIKEGLRRARLAGKQVGATRVVDQPMLSKMMALRADGMGYRDIAKEVGIATGTAYKYVTGQSTL